METKIFINKIRKILNTGVDSYCQKSKTIGALALKLRVDLGLRQSSRWNSMYNPEPFVLPNGDTLTLRIADHKATPEQFIKHFNTKYNVVLLIGEKTENIEIQNYIESEIYSEILYKPECFNNKNKEQTITEILLGLINTFETGEFTKGEMGYYLVKQKFNDQNLGTTKSHKKIKNKMRNYEYLSGDGFAMFGADFYPTPIEVIDRMLEFSDVVGKVILEPSAGKGNIVDYLNNAGAKEVLVCEQEPNLKSILSDKKCRFLKDNFLEVSSVEVSHIDMIVMNPPFSKQEDHILHAYEIAPDGCEIISLCNYKSDLYSDYNPYRTEKNQKILDLIEKYGNIEDFGDCFSNAERKTNVRVGCIKIYKPKSEKSKEFDDYFDYSQEDDEKIPNVQEGLITYDFVKDTVNTYVEACKQFESVKYKNDTINNLIHKFTNEYEYGNNEIAVLFKVTMTYETFKKELQKKAWRWVLAKFNLNKYLTEKAKQQINRFVEKQVNVPFTVKNIYKMVDVIIGTHASRMDQTLVDAFDMICSFSDENTTAGPKWKTNSNYQINKKFIIDGGFKDWYDRGHPDYNSHYVNKVEDVIKALCYLTGRNYSDYLPFYRTVKDYRFGDGWVNLIPFFEVQFFKKGTAHFKFKDEKVLELFNRRVAEIKGWALPQQSNATKEEKRKAQTKATREQNKKTKAEAKKEESNLPTVVVETDNKKSQIDDLKSILENLKKVNAKLKENKNDK